MPEISDNECISLVQKPEKLDRPPFESSLPPPLVLLFGWAGANHKAVSKYGDVYRSVGCTTVQYLLGARHICRHPGQVAQLMELHWKNLEDQNMATQPMFIHCFSDTGIHAYRGMRKAATSRSANMDVRGVIWDSCPGPRSKYRKLNFNFNFDGPSALAGSS